MAKFFSALLFYNVKSKIKFSNNGLNYLMSAVDYSGPT